jgi:hypothetical protein
MRKFPLSLTICLLGLTSLCFFTGIVPGVRGQEIAVNTTSFGTSIESSAVEPIGSGKFLLVANDKEADLLIVQAETGIIANNRLSIQDSNSGNPKWEAMAKDGEDYYIVGHYCSCLYSFSLENEAETDSSKIKIKTKSREFTVKPPIEDQISRQIEGLAVWVNANKEKELVVGIRDLPGKELIRIYRTKIKDCTELSLEEFFAFIAEKPKGRKVEWHLSSIEYVQRSDGFLVVTSTEEGTQFYGNKVWFVSREKLKASQPSPLTGKFKDTTNVMIGGKVFDSKMKAEGLAIINEAKFTGVIVFDNDDSGTTNPAKLAVLDLSKLIEIK